MKLRIYILIILKIRPTNLADEKEGEKLSWICWIFLRVKQWAEKDLGSMVLD